MKWEEGGTALLKELYCACYNSLLSFGTNTGLKHETTKDLINQLFLGFMEKPPDFAAIVNRQAYVMTAFRNKVIDFLRKKAHHTQSLDEPTIDLPTEPAADSRILRDESLAVLESHLAAAFTKLPPRYKKVIYLRYYEGLSHEEIGQRMGISVRTVYNSLFESLKQLRSDLKPFNLEIADIMLLLLALGSTGAVFPG